MGSALENLRSMRKDVKSRETKLFGTKSFAGILRVRDLEEGKTTFRVAKHSEDTLPFAPIRTTWLDVEESIQNLSRYQMEQLIKDRKLEKALGVKKVEELKEIEDDDLRAALIDELGADFTTTVRKSIFISKIHGNPELPDVVEEYIKFANKMINDIIQDPEERKKKKAPISGWRDKAQKWNPGIMPSTNYVGYMFPLETSDTELKRFEMYPAQMDEIEKLYAKFDDPQEPLTVDPFSDPEEGWPIEFNKVKNDKGGFDITITDKPSPKKLSGAEFVAQFALTDAQIEELEGKPSLTKMYINVYGKRDFTLALNGLQLFDEKHELNVFQNDEFLQIVEQLSEHYAGQPEGEEVKEENKPEPKSSRFAKKAEPVEDDLKVLDEKPKHLAGRLGQKAPVKDERETLIGELKALDPTVRILPRHTVEDIKEMIEEMKSEMENNANFNDDGEANDLPEPTQEVKPNSLRERMSATKTQPDVTDTPKTDVKVDKLAAFKEKLKAKQNNQ